MDELTPIEPEYREIPPEQPPQMPDYYGTGAQPQPKKSRLPLILTLLTVLMAANLITVAVSLFVDGKHTQTQPTEEDKLLPVLDDELAQEDHKNPSLPMEQNDTTMLKEIYAHYAPASVAITVQSERGTHCSTGVILTTDGYVLTDAELFSQPAHLSVTLFDGTSCHAAFVGIDPSGEMAVLKLDAQNLSAVALSEEVSRQAQQLLMELLQSIAKPASLQLSVTDVPRPMQIYWSLPEGVMIHQITAGSNAYRAGLRPGDVLIRIGHEEITTIGDYLEALNSYHSGETVRIYLYRQGVSYYTDVCLD